jgi:hypothetical protein
LFPFECILVLPKLSDSIWYLFVAAGFSLRFSLPDGYMKISRKLRNLKVAATKIAQYRYFKNLSKE